MAFSRVVALCCIVFLILGCSSRHEKVALKPTLPYSTVLANAKASIPSLEDIFTLTAQQQVEFLQYFHSTTRQNVSPHQRISNYLADVVVGFDYQGKNYTASEALELKQGNCISLALLTKAFADLADIDISFQHMMSTPVFSIEEDWFISSDHVRSFLFAPQELPAKRNEIMFRSFVVIDYFPSAGDSNGGRLSKATFIAMYYRNLAADALLEGNYEKTLALLREALKYAPEYSPIINLTALVHKYIGQQAMAEQWYQYGLNVSGQKTTLLSNYAILKQSQGEMEKAAALWQELETLHGEDPYLWYVQGKRAMQQQHYSVAIKKFGHLVDYAPYVAQFHLELAKSYYYDQRFADARLALLHAADILKSPTDKQRFNAKLFSMQRHAALP